MSWDEEILIENNTTTYLVLNYIYMNIGGLEMNNSDSTILHLTARWTKLYSFHDITAAASDVIRKDLFIRRLSSITTTDVIINICLVTGCLINTLIK